MLKIREEDKTKKDKKNIFWKLDINDMINEMNILWNALMQLQKSLRKKPVNGTYTKVREVLKNLCLNKEAFKLGKWIIKHNLTNENEAELIINYDNKFLFSKKWDIDKSIYEIIFEKLRNLTKLDDPYKYKVLDILFDNIEDVNLDEYNNLQYLYTHFASIKKWDYLEEKKYNTIRKV